MWVGGVEARCRRSSLRIESAVVLSEELAGEAKILQGLFAASNDAVGVNDGPGVVLEGPDDTMALGEHRRRGERRCWWRRTSCRRWQSILKVRITFPGRVVPIGGSLQDCHSGFSEWGFSIQACRWISGGRRTLELDGVIFARCRGHGPGAVDHVGGGQDGEPLEPRGGRLPEEILPVLAVEAFEPGRVACRSPLSARPWGSPYRSRARRLFPSVGELMAKSLGVDAVLDEVHDDFVRITSVNLAVRQSILPVSEIDGVDDAEPVDVETRLPSAAAVGVQPLKWRYRRTSPSCWSCCSIRSEALKGR